MTDKELIRAEIVRLMSGYKPIVGGVDELTGANIVLAKLLSFLDTLPDEPITPCKELAEAAEKYADGPECSWVGTSALEQAFIAGAEWQKRKMIGQAVEGEVRILPGYGAYVKEKNNNSLEQYLLDNFKTGDDVAIIILPKED